MFRPSTSHRSLEWSYTIQTINTHRHTYCYTVDYKLISVITGCCRSLCLTPGTKDTQLRISLDLWELLVTYVEDRQTLLCRAASKCDRQFPSYRQFSVKVKIQGRTSSKSNHFDVVSQYMFIHKLDHVDRDQRSVCMFTAADRPRFLHHICQTIVVLEPILSPKHRTVMTKKLCVIETTSMCLCRLHLV